MRTTKSIHREDILGTLKASNVPKISKKEEIITQK
jgi:hypothetical protein